ncbi:hypothetical protein ACLMJK_003165 [Lecanora helva]
MTCRQNIGLGIHPSGWEGICGEAGCAGTLQLGPSGAYYGVNNTSSSYKQTWRPGLHCGRINAIIYASGYTEGMSKNATPNLDSLSLSDTELEDTEDLFASPSVAPKKQKSTQRSDPAQNQTSAPPPETEEDALIAHENSLRRELTSLRTMNQVVSGVIESLEKAKSNMEAVSATVSNASTLLNTWTRILSQTEHNQRLLLNPRWQGASRDITDGENEEILRRQEQERKEAEDIRRAEAREREKEEEERRRMTEGASSKGPRGLGRGRGSVRGSTRSGGHGYVGVGGQGGVRGTSSRGSSISGRGHVPGRGTVRGRGK